MTENILNSPNKFLDGVSRETRIALQEYHSLLEKWNQRINLVAPGQDIFHRHILDSAQILSLLPSDFSQLTLADFGSGGGLPGIVLSILGVGHVHLIESDARKSAFLREAVLRLSLRATIHNQRIETINLPQCDVFTARALAPLPELLAYVKPHLQQGAFCLFPKGKNWSIEVEQARERWSFSLEIIPSRTAPDSAILRIHDIAELPHGGKTSTAKRRKASTKH